MLTVYTTAACTPCKMVKQFLDSKGADYQTVILDENPEKVDEVVAISGGMNVPVVTDGKYVVVGWAPNKLIALIEG